MASKISIKIAKVASVIFSIIGVVYTVILIYDYVNQTRNKLEASYYSFDLYPYLSKLERNSIYSVVQEEEIKNLKFAKINKYLKNPITIENLYSHENLRNELQEMKEALTSPLIEALVNRNTICEIKIENISDKEVKDIKVDLSDFTSTFESYIYIINKENIPFSTDTTTILKGLKSEHVIFVGNLLPREIKSVTIFGLTNILSNKKYPRIIYPDGYITAYGLGYIKNKGVFNKFVLWVVSMPKILQTLILFILILGFFYLFKMSFSFTKLIFKDK
ncbi:MAG: hypothetical protein J0M10_16505 [Chitinophagales bacterium]|nr:hypothetical protein [Chitinophagales bacterium]